MANAVEAPELAASDPVSKEIPHVESDPAQGGSLKDVEGAESRSKDCETESKVEVDVKEKAEADVVKMEEVSEKEVKGDNEPDRVQPEGDVIIEPVVEPKSEVVKEPEVDEGVDVNKETGVDNEVDGEKENDAEPEFEAKPELELEPDLEQEAEHELEPEQEPEQDLEPEQEDEEEEIDEEEEEEEHSEEKIEKPLDDDQDRRNPQYIPKGGAFYEHDNRTSLEDVENKDPQENEKKKKSWKEAKESEKWSHDRYNELEQQPKSSSELIETYGYDIRNDEGPPRARRRRKYGRGPDKYERSWEDEQAYLVKQNIGRRGKKKQFGRDEFPPLPNQKSDSSIGKPVQRASPRKKDEEGGSKSVNLKLNGNEKSPTTSQGSRSSYSGNHNSIHSFHSNRKNYSHMNKKVNDDDIKPFRNDDNKWKNNFKHGRQEDYPKPIKTQSIRNSDPPFKRFNDSYKSSAKESDISHISDGISQMTFHNKHTGVKDIRLKSNGPDENKSNEPEMDSPANRQNPKRYSKIRKGFTGIFPPEEVPELDQSEIRKMQEQKSQHINMTQPLNMQNVMKRYAGSYGNLVTDCISDFVPGNTSYIQARPIISGIPQQAMSPQGIHQQALSPQGIPQQALRPSVAGLQTIELQQNPLGQPNFVAQPMFFDMDPHYTSDVMGPLTGFSPYSGNQTGNVYQPSRGITYYNTECQNSGQERPPPRQKAAIPIIPPE